MFGRLIDSLSERAIRLIVVGVLLMLAAVPVVTFLWMTSVPGRSFAGPLPLLDTDQARLAETLRADVTAIASEPHNVAHPRALEEAARHIEQRLAAIGYTVHRQPFRVDGHDVRNIDVVIEPTAADAPTLVIGAHYDSAGEAPGANDNGSGVAALLALAERLASLRSQSALRIRLAFFVNEEPPYFQTPNMGSLVYAKALAATGEKLVGMMSLETMGYFSDRVGSQHYPPPLGLRYPDRGDFIAFVGLTSSRPFVRKTVSDFREVARFPSVGGSAPGFVQGIDWSDHWSFGKVGVASLMVTDTAPFRYPHYHSLKDTPDKVDYQRLARVTSGLEQVVRQWASAGGKEQSIASHPRLAQ